LLRQFRLVEAPILPIKRNGWTPDENHRIALQRIDAAQERLIRKTDLIVRGIKNPSFNLWAGKQILSGCKVSDGAYKISFSWANLTQYPHLRDYNDHPAGLDSITLAGLDQRVLVVNDTLAVVAYSICPAEGGCRNGWYQMAYAELEIVGQVPHQSVAVRSRNLLLHPSLNYGTVYGLDRHKNVEFPVQKNWTPFLYNGTLLFIERINPLRVMTIDENFTQHEANPNDSAIVRLVSSGIPLDLGSWVEWIDPRDNEYHLRGGTNAVYVPGYDVYLAFFHTRPKLHGTPLVTYFVGGFTFTSKMPFRLVSISQMPIVDDWMYNGPWMHTKASYVPFPTTLWLEDDQIKIVMGYNDQQGYLLTLDLREFMHSLVRLSED